MGIGSKKQATFLGARASKASLAATFRVRPTGRRINKPKREPSLRGLGKIFREATIRKGKPIPTPGQFIEKRGKRLTTRKEVSLLQAARKRKSSGGFFKKSGRGVVL